VKPFILKIKLNIRYNFLNWFICAYGSGSGPKKDRIRNTDRTVGAAAGLRLPRGSRHPHLECCQEGDHQLEACCSHFHNLSEMCHIVHYAYYRTVRYATIWIILLAYGTL
jgi:hypothetical protein